MILETERLILRPWEESDAADLYEYARDPRVGPMAGWLPHTSVENSRQVIREILAVPETYAICLKADSRAVGSIGIHFQTDMTDDPHEAEVGYWIGVPFWGNGYVPEAVRRIQRRAFAELGLTRLWCGYYDGNERSHRVQQKCGFVFHHTTEGLFVPAMNETRTGHVSTLSAEDWRKIQEASR